MRVKTTQACLAHTVGQCQRNVIGGRRSLESQDTDLWHFKGRFQTLEPNPGHFSKSSKGYEVLKHHSVKVLKWNIAETLPENTGLLKPQRQLLFD